MKILLIGSGAREHAIARTFKRSPQPVDLLCFGSSRNPGIHILSTAYAVGATTNAEAAATFAHELEADLAIVGPEAPLEVGLADALWTAGVPCVGPRRNLVRIEASKGFARRLLQKYGIDASPKFQTFASLDGVASFLEELGDHYVVKYDGLMGGKGVKVAGEHLHSHAEALKYCQGLVEVKGPFVIEEKMRGQEFSLMSFCDGKSLIHMPPIQDHKRAYEGDTGPNTGGMGSYSAPDHSLPFLTELDMAEAQRINERTTEALACECKGKYQGILYGGFMATPTGVKLVEYNARFGDPEALNVLTLLQSDFVAICQAMTEGTLEQTDVRFAPLATVCKYAVPEGYPNAPLKGEKIDISAVQDPDRLFFGAVDAREDGLYEIGSRTLAVVGVAPTLSEAEQIAEAEIRRVRGPLFHRQDIGTKDLLKKRVAHMQKLRKT